MAVTDANTKSRNNVEPPKIAIVNTLPALGNVELGEMFLLIQDSHADDKKVHIRVATGWLKSAAFS